MCSANKSCHPKNIEKIKTRYLVIFLLDSTANPAKIQLKWTWFGAIFRRQIINGSHDLDFFCFPGLKTFIGSETHKQEFLAQSQKSSPYSAVFSGGAGGASAPPEFGGSQKGQSLISTYQSLAITTNTPGFEKLNTALPQSHLVSTISMWDTL